MIRLKTLAGIALVSLAAGASAQTTAITGATVHTMGPQGTVENATVVIEDGQFVSVEAGGAVPQGATIINASGKVVTPGLFTPIGYLGLVEVGFSAGPLDQLQRGDEFTASFDVADAFNPRSTLIAVNRIEGVTRAVIVPSPGFPDESGQMGSVLSGLAAMVNLGGGHDSLEQRSVAMMVSLGESGSGLAGGSRAGAILELRAALDEARSYGDDPGEREDYRLSISDLEALQGVLSGDVPLYVNVDRASDMAVLIEIVDEYGLQAIVFGGAESWMVADDLAAADIPVVLAPQDILPGNFDRINSRRETAAILAEAGVTIAFADGQSHTHNARNVTQSAGNAVAFGLPYDDAIRAITIGPAEIFGVADRVGSIEAGKEADIVIWPADPLELTSYAEQVFIQGNAVDMTSRQTLLRDRYLQMDSDEPPAWRK
ncbi:MAG: amidohydrolase family protein [Woeseiaceae bacterium]